MDVYYLGQTIDLGPEVIRDAEGEATTADEKAVTVTSPSGEQLLELSIEGAGGDDGYSVPALTLDEPGTWHVEWLLTNGEYTAAHAYQLLVVARGFATVSDVTARLGRADSALEDNAQIAMLLDLATTLIAEAAGQDAAWAADLDPVPVALRVIAIEAVVRVLLNPSGVRQMQQTLGSYSRGETFGTDHRGGLALTDDEESRIRRAIYGASSGSASVRSVVHDVWPGIEIEADDDE